MSLFELKLTGAPSEFCLVLDVDEEQGKLQVTSEVGWVEAVFGSGCPRGVWILPSRAAL